MLHFQELQFWLFYWSIAGMQVLKNEQMNEVHAASLNWTDSLELEFGVGEEIRVPGH